METVIKQAISDTLQSQGLPEVSFVVEHPADTGHGDYASNVALVLAKQVGKSPRHLAKELAAALTDTIEYVTEVSVAGPGFLNFRLHRDFFVREMVRIKEQGDQWGSNERQRGEEVLIEYTSPNLFKPLHIGNLVGNIIGESFVRLFTFAGATVRRLNYPSDIGLTVAKGVWGLKTSGKDPHDINTLGEAYRLGNEAYEQDAAAKAEIEAVNRALYAGTDDELSVLREVGLATSQARFAELCRLLGTEFDTQIYESEASESGVQMVQAHQGSVFVESEGAVVYPGEKVGLHTRVFVNSQGLPTYEAKDLGNFVQKQKHYPYWTRSVVITGNEQREYFKVLHAVMEEIFPEAKERVLEHIPTGFLTLTTGKMSSRKGRVLTGESLLAELMEEAKRKAEQTRTDNIQELTEAVAVAALKYQILHHGVGSDIVFNKERALSFEGDSGPYLQYTHARIISVLEKAESVGVTPAVLSVPEEPYAIERLVYQFPEVIDAALAERAPHQVATYLTQLAGAFNTFYATEKIADPDDQYAPYKAAVSDAVRITLKNGLWVLGIKAPGRL